MAAVTGSNTASWFSAASLRPRDGGSCLGRPVAWDPLGRRELISQPVKPTTVKIS